ncbi:MAG TPA: amidohydrolase family protein [Candidatus Woesebacteria bacterium]|nr:amidohydrolase family protein [Candidatus Woesebacteria bacterium]
MNKKENWNLKTLVLEKIKDNGGWVNAHSHLDRAYTITDQDLALSNQHLQQKWELVDELKKRSTVAQIYDRMAFALEKQLAQGVTALGTFIDVDDVIKDKATQAAARLKENYQTAIDLVFINQTLKGVLDAKARKWLEEALNFVDIIGGLPARDAGREDEHLDVLFSLAKQHKKMVHVHVDQLNTVREKETELLIKKTREHKLQGQVVAVHSVSLAAQPIEYRQKIYQQLQQQQLMVIVCPTAWIDSRRSEELMVSHNAIAPVEELVAAQIPVALGTDNIADIYKPFSDGEMWTELRFLLEACHFYDIDALVKIATVNGRKVLGLSI